MRHRLTSTARLTLTALTGTLCLSMLAPSGSAAPPAGSPESPPTSPKAAPTATRPINGPTMFQASGSSSCTRGTFCLYAKHSFNENPDDPTTPGQTPSRTVWQSDREWPHFVYYSGGTGYAGEPLGSNRPTDRVAAVVNNTNHSIYLMEHDFTTAAAPPQQCVEIPAHRKVANLRQQNTDEGYGSVGFNDHGNTCRKINTDPSDDQPK